MNRGFILDLNRCTGCDACRLACRIENGWDEARGWREVYTFNESRYPLLPLYHLSLACNHCSDAPCMKNCPALAYGRDRQTGAVVLHPGRCIGCKYCSWVCPFDAPQFRKAAGVMSKCTLCNHRLAEGLAPVCASLCPTGALRYGDMDGNGVEAVHGFPTTDFRPSIRFVPLRGDRQAPECTAAAPSAPNAATAAGLPPQPPSQISPATEWPLALFSLAAAVLVAWTAAAAAGAVAAHPLVFLFGGAAALGISSIHLGRRTRAWRALLNLRASWLSREIFFFLSFLALAALGNLESSLQGPAGWGAVLAGFAALYSIDRVYDPALKPLSTYLHSAGAVLTGVFFLGIFLGDPLLTISSGSLKLVLYLLRKIRLRRALSPTTYARIAAGFALPAALWLVSPVLCALLVAGGELIDRMEYYRELEIPSPRREIKQRLDKFLIQLRKDLSTR